jgi:hypothetical protein
VSCKKKKDLLCKGEMDLLTVCLVRGEMDLTSWRGKAAYLGLTFAGAV